MKVKAIIFLFLFGGVILTSYSQLTDAEITLAKIRNAGFTNSEAMKMLSNLTDVYGQRLTGSREYYAAANWISGQMKKSGLQNVRFENYCTDCRGWGIKSFNVEMTAPNYMNISAYPLVMSKSTAGTLSAELVHIEGFEDMNSVKKNYSGKINGKIILLGKEPTKKSLHDTLSFSYSEEQLMKKESQQRASVE